jgi:hypothetical protein
MKHERISTTNPMSLLSSSEVKLFNRVAEILMRLARADGGSDHKEQLADDLREIAQKRGKND